MEKTTVLSLPPKIGGFITEDLVGYLVDDFIQITTIFISLLHDSVAGSCVNHFAASTSRRYQRWHVKGQRPLTDVLFFLLLGLSIDSSSSKETMMIPGGTMAMGLGVRDSIS